ncbi:MAG: hypothetical protein L6R39_001992 [Caloplaca ligustica]|nr:MAG: hypothetical protein L6R39_001992 [Caloplaca ligustica]
MVNHSHNVEVLSIGDDHDSSATYYRLSEGSTRIVYVSIDAGIYDQDDYISAPLLLSKLPPFPTGKWNRGHITRLKENPEPHFAWTRYAELERITSTWHKQYIEYLSLDFGESLMPNVAEALHPELGEVIAKFARFEWEIGHYEAETRAYRWIDGHDIGPRFLGHLVEEGRVIGFLLQKVDGHHAGTEDLARCEEVVRRLHSLDIVHGDLHRHNFLMTEDRVTLIDFETAEKCQAEDIKSKQLKELRQELLGASAKGGARKPWAGEIEESEGLTRQADEGKNQYGKRR